MCMLNDPVGYDEADKNDWRWTPARGLLRAAAYGTFSSAVLVAVLAPLAWFLPLFLMNWFLRGAVAFGIAWILFGVIQRRAGMVGWPITAMVIGLTSIVLVLHHVIFAIQGLPVFFFLWRSPVVWETLTEQGWFSLGTFVVINMSSFIAVAFCSALCHFGRPGAGTFVSFLTFGRW